MTLFSKLLSCKFHLRVAFNPYIRFKSASLGYTEGVTCDKRNIPIIISLTSFPERFDDLELALYSLLTQTVKPDRIILWFTDEYDLLRIPYSISKYIKNGLEIRFVKDIGPYTKIMYALKEFSDSIIVTADDDVVYPADWLEKLYHSYISHPDDIQVHRAHRVIATNDEYAILPYEKWEKHVIEESAKYDNFLTGVGGVLYPPRCFNAEVYRSDLYLKYSPNADDVWLWFMALISGRKIRVVKNHIDYITCTNYFRNLGLFCGKTLYSTNCKGSNDIQVKSLINFYGSQIISKLKKQ